MNGQLPADVWVCPRCQARNFRSFTACWLCSQQETAQAPSPHRPAPGRLPALENATADEKKVSPLLIVTMLLLLIGGLDSSGFGFILVLVLIPLFFAQLLVASVGGLEQRLAASRQAPAKGESDKGGKPSASGGMGVLDIAFAMLGLIARGVSSIVIGAVTIFAALFVTCSAIALLSSVADNFRRLR